MAFDGLTDIFDDIPMGESTDNFNKSLGLTREAQDEFSARSHQRAAIAQKNGVFDDEITPVLIPQRKGDPIEFTTDEGIRAGHHRRVARQAASGVHEGRDDHGRLVLADLRRRGRSRGDEQGQGGGTGTDLARRDRCARQRRGPGQLAAVAARQRDQARAVQGRPVASTTSTWSRSTRRSRPSACSRWPISGSTRRRSTSTAARSRSVTRSACPARGSRSRSPTDRTVPQGPPRPGNAAVVCVQLRDALSRPHDGPADGQRAYGGVQRVLTAGRRAAMLPTREWGSCSPALVCSECAGCDGLDDAFTAGPAAGLPGAPGPRTSSRGVSARGVDRTVIPSGRSRPGCRSGRSKSMPPIFF